MRNAIISGSTKYEKITQLSLILLAWWANIGELLENKFNGAIRILKSLGKLIHESEDENCVTLLSDTWRKRKNNLSLMNLQYEFFIIGKR